MHIKLSTKVNKNYREVFQAFDINLFMKLKPPLVSLNVIRFDGCKTGDEVHLETGILGSKQKWISKITDNYSGYDCKYFIDEGLLLPNPLKYWKHKHIIENCVDSSVIIDDICYKTGNIFMDFLIFPAFFLQFLYRKPVYKRYFNK